MVLSSIDFSDYIGGIKLEESPLKDKCERMLMFYFLLDDSIEDRLNCVVNYILNP